VTGRRGEWALFSLSPCHPVSQTQPGDSITRIYPPGFALDGIVKAGTLLHQGLPLLHGVDKHIRRYREIGQRQFQRSAPERLVRTVENDDHVQVAADAPVPASIGTNVSDANNTRVLVGDFPGPFRNSIMNCLLIEPFDDRRIQ
jgi:hypothetical protein